jgi:prostaglandin-endoperoxide synthase 2
MRDRSRDGWQNQLETHVLTSFEPVWSLLQRVEPLRKLTNRALIGRAILKFPTRPNPFSTLAPYSSWESLTDRRYDSRHLPPVAQDGLPAEDKVADLMMRRGAGVECAKSTVMFAYFAQWFTDGFLRSDRSPERDPRRNDTNHELDLTPLYGVRKEITDALRAHEGGRLKSQVIGGAEYPPYLYEGGRIKPEFAGLSVVRPGQIPPDRFDTLFATGSDTTNSQIGFVILNVLFLREHNRLAGLLAAEYPSWDDERLYATARNILIVLLIKIVVEEYINHIAPYLFKFGADPWDFKGEAWYRTNWMAIEFNLLYRWHSLIPSTLRVAGGELPIWETIFRTDLVTDNGIARLFTDASNQPAGQVGMLNTDPALRETELASVREARAVGLDRYNAYRELAKFPRVTSFEQITGDPARIAALREVYRSADEIEFYPGLFAEDPRPNSVLPPLIGRMVGIDAFSQALTNPLLSPRLFNEHTFSPLGLDVIRRTKSLSDVLNRNVPESPGSHFVSMTRRDWRRVPPGG